LLGYVLEPVRKTPVYVMLADPRRARRRRGEERRKREKEETTALG
jgi:hypothetical protein